MTSHGRNTTIESCVNLFTLQTTPTEGPLPSFNSIQHSRQAISKCLEEPVESTSRRQLRKAPSELLKNNILRIKQSERICKLKEQTSTNVQMFLRIKAQASHYKLKDAKRQASCQQLLRLRHKFSEGSSQVKLRSRCQSAKINLIGRCTELRQSISREHGQYRSNGEGCQSENGSKQANNLYLKISQRTCNKENEGFNVRQGKTRCYEVGEAGSRAIAKKLGQPPAPSLLKGKILINTEGEVTREHQRTRFVRGSQASSVTSSSRGPKGLSERAVEFGGF